MRVEKLDERWTSTTMQAAFSIHLPSYPAKDSISIDLPLLRKDLGWAFTVSLTGTREVLPNKKNAKSKQITRRKWVLAAFSFHQHDSTIPWGNTSMHAQLSLDMNTQVLGDLTPGCAEETLGAINCVLTQSPSTEVPLTGSCTLSLLRPIGVRLTVTILDCPFASGLFQATSHVSEAETRSVKQSVKRVLGRSLASGKPFDVKFLTSPTRSVSGNTGQKLLPTYASLSVLEDHVKLSSAKLGEGWTATLAALNNNDNVGTKHADEILCPTDYEHELDSDFEDEDDSVEPCASPPPYGRNSATTEETSTKRSSSSFSSYVLDGVSDQGMVDYLHGEVIKGPGETTTANSERTILVKFAAHRTWHAFLWYCYTGHLEFSKLKSQAEPGAQHLRGTHPEDGPPPCSPKSMYRLAVLVGDDVLEAKALEAIRGRMTKANLLDESFSVFTSKYPDVREIQLDVLMECCGSPEVKKAFLRKMLKNGKLDHAEPVLSAFYDRLVA